jgi:hypothetical protein
MVKIQGEVKWTPEKRTVTFPVTRPVKKAIVERTPRMFF